MGKPIGQVGAAGGASKVWGPVTEYTRNLRLNGYIIGSASEIFDSNLLIKEDFVTQPIIFPHGYDEAGGPSPIIGIDEIPQFRTILTDVVPGKEYNRHFPGLQAEVDAHNAANPSIIDQRSLWTVADDVRWRSRPFYDLKIGTDVVAIADNCWEDNFEIGPITRFAGAGDISIGKSAFSNFGVAKGNVFKNMKYLFIQDKSFYAASCGSVNLIECTVENATEAFRKADLKNGDFIMTACKGSEIPYFFAAEVQNLIGISIDMEGEASIGERAFNSCRAENLYIWDGCTSIGEHAFSNNNFRYALDMLPPSIVEYGPSCFRDSNIKTLLIDPNGAALFEEWSFGNNSIENAYVLLKGIFLKNSFTRAFDQKNRSDVVNINQGSIRGESFKNNIVGDIIINGRTEVLGDGAFLNTHIRNRVVIAQDSLVKGRHTFTKDGGSNSNGNDFYVEDLTSLSSSWKTFQRTDATKGRPGASMMYFPDDVSVMPENWSQTRDLGCSYLEAVAYSNVHTGNAIQWRTLSPEQITVSFGLDTATIDLADAEVISGTNSTIQRGGAYSEEYPGSAEGGYTGGDSVGYDYYSISLNYQPYSAIWTDRKENVEVYMNGNVAPEFGKGGWTAYGSSNNFAPESEVYWNAPLHDPAGISLNAQNFPADRVEVSNVVSARSVTNNAEAVSATIGFNGHTWGDRVDSAFWLQPGEREISFNPSNDHLYVPASQVENVDSIAFRMKHNFLGYVSPLP